MCRYIFGGSLIAIGAIPFLYRLTLDDKNDYNKLQILSMDPDDKNSLVFRNDTDSEQFEKVYLYSIQNPVEVELGNYLPLFEEVGPFVFRVKEEVSNIKKKHEANNSGNDDTSVSFEVRRTLEPIPELSMPFDTPIHTVDVESATKNLLNAHRNPFSNEVKNGLGTDNNTWESKLFHTWRSMSQHWRDFAYYFPLSCVAAHVNVSKIKEAYPWSSHLFDDPVLGLSSSPLALIHWLESSDSYTATHKLVSHFPSHPLLDLLSILMLLREIRLAIERSMLINAKARLGLNSFEELRYLTEGLISVDSSESGSLGKLTHIHRFISWVPELDVEKDKVADAQIRSVEMLTIKKVSRTEKRRRKEAKESKNEDGNNGEHSSTSNAYSQNKNNEKHFEFLSVRSLYDNASTAGLEPILSSSFETTKRRVLEMDRRIFWGRLDTGTLPSSPDLLKSVLSDRMQNHPLHLGESMQPSDLGIEKGKGILHRNSNISENLASSIIRMDDDGQALSFLFLNGTFLDPSTSLPWNDSQLKKSLFTSAMSAPSVIAYRNDKEWSILREVQKRKKMKEKDQIVGREQKQDDKNKNKQNKIECSSNEDNKISSCAPMLTASLRATLYATIALEEFAYGRFTRESGGFTIPIIQPPTEEDIKSSSGSSSSLSTFISAYANSYPLFSTVNTSAIHFRMGNAIDDLLITRFPSELEIEEEKRKQGQPSKWTPSSRVNIGSNFPPNVIVDIAEEKKDNAPVSAEANASAANDEHSSAAESNIKKKKNPIHHSISSVARRVGTVASVMRHILSSPRDFLSTVCLKDSNFIPDDVFETDLIAIKSKIKGKFDDSKHAKTNRMKNFNVFSTKGDRKPKRTIDNLIQEDINELNAEEIILESEDSDNELNFDDETQSNLDKNPSVFNGIYKFGDRKILIDDENSSLKSFISTLSIKDFQFLSQDDRRSFCRTISPPHTFQTSSESKLLKASQRPMSIIESIFASKLYQQEENESIEANGNINFNKIGAYSPGVDENLLDDSTNSINGDVTADPFFSDNSDITNFRFGAGFINFSQYPRSSKPPSSSYRSNEFYRQSIFDFCFIESLSAPSIHCATAREAVNSLYAIGSSLYPSELPLSSFSIPKQRQEREQVASTYAPSSNTDKSAIESTQVHSNDVSSSSTEKIESQSSLNDVSNHAPGSLSSIFNPPLFQSTESAEEIAANFSSVLASYHNSPFLSMVEEASFCSSLVNDPLWRARTRHIIVFSTMRTDDKNSCFERSYNEVKRVRVTSTLISELEAKIKDLSEQLLGKPIDNQSSSIPHPDPKISVKPRPDSIRLQRLIDLYASQIHSLRNQLRSISFLPPEMASPQFSSLFPDASSSSEKNHKYSLISGSLTPVNTVEGWCNSKTLRALETAPKIGWGTESGCMMWLRSSNLDWEKFRLYADSEIDRHCDSFSENEDERLDCLKHLTFIPSTDSHFAPNDVEIPDSYIIHDIAISNAKTVESKIRSLSNVYQDDDDIQKLMKIVKDEETFTEPKLSFLSTLNENIQSKASEEELNIKNLIEIVADSTVTRLGNFIFPAHTRLLFKYKFNRALSEAGVSCTPLAIANTTFYFSSPQNSGDSSDDFSNVGIDTDIDDEKAKILKEKKISELLSCSSSDAVSLQMGRSLITAKVLPFLGILPSNPKSSVYQLLHLKSRFPFLYFESPFDLLAVSPSQNFPFDSLIRKSDGTLNWSSSFVLRSLVGNRLVFPPLQEIPYHGLMNRQCFLTLPHNFMKSGPESFVEFNRQVSNLFQDFFMNEERNLSEPPPYVRTSIPNREHLQEQERAQHISSQFEPSTPQVFPFILPYSIAPNIERFGPSIYFDAFRKAFLKKKFQHPVPPESLIRLPGLPTPHRALRESDMPSAVCGVYSGDSLRSLFNSASSTDSHSSNKSSSTQWQDPGESQFQDDASKYTITFRYSPAEPRVASTSKSVGSDHVDPSDANSHQSSRQSKDNSSHNPNLRLFSIEFPSYFRAEVSRLMEIDDFINMIGFESALHFNKEENDVLGISTTSSSNVYENIVSLFEQVARITCPGMPSNVARNNFGAVNSGLSSPAEGSKFLFDSAAFLSIENKKRKETRSSGSDAKPSFSFSSVSEVLSVDLFNVLRMKSNRSNSSRSSSSSSPNSRKHMPIIQIWGQERSKLIQNEATINEDQIISEMVPDIPRASIQNESSSPHIGKTHMHPWHFVFDKSASTALSTYGSYSFRDHKSYVAGKMPLDSIHSTSFMKIPFESDDMHSLEEWRMTVMQTIFKEQTPLSDFAFRTKTLRRSLAKISNFLEVDSSLPLREAISSSTAASRVRLTAQVEIQKLIHHIYTRAFGLGVEVFENPFVASNLLPVGPSIRPAIRSLADFVTGGMDIHEESQTNEIPNSFEKKFLHEINDVIRSQLKLQTEFRRLPRFRPRSSHLYRRPISVSKFLFELPLLRKTRPNPLSSRTEQQPHANSKTNPKKAVDSQASPAEFSIAAYLINAQILSSPDRYSAENEELVAIWDCSTLGAFVRTTDAAIRATAVGHTLKKKFAGSLLFGENSVSFDLPKVSKTLRSQQKIKEVIADDSATPENDVHTDLFKNIFTPSSIGAIDLLDDSRIRSVGGSVQTVGLLGSSFDEESVSKVWKPLPTTLSKIATQSVTRHLTSLNLGLVARSLFISSHLRDKPYIVEFAGGSKDEARVFLSEVYDGQNDLTTPSARVERDDHTNQEVESRSESYDLADSRKTEVSSSASGSTASSSPPQQRKEADAETEEIRPISLSSHRTSKQRRMLWKFGVSPSSANLNWQLLKTKVLGEFEFILSSTAAVGSLRRPDPDWTLKRSFPDDSGRIFIDPNEEDYEDDAYDYDYNDYDFYDEDSDVDIENYYSVKNDVHQNLKTVKTLNNNIKSSNVKDHITSLQFFSEMIPTSFKVSPPPSPSSILSSLPNILQMAKFATNYPPRNLISIPLLYVDNEDLDCVRMGPSTLLHPYSPAKRLHDATRSLLSLRTEDINRILEISYPSFLRSVHLDDLVLSRAIKNHIYNKNQSNTPRKGSHQEDGGQGPSLPPSKFHPLFSKSSVAFMITKPNFVRSLIPSASSTNKKNLDKSMQDNASNPATTTSTPSANSMRRRLRNLFPDGMENIVYRPVFSGDASILFPPLHYRELRHKVYLPPPSSPVKYTYKLPKDAAGRGLLQSAESSAIKLVGVSSRLPDEAIHIQSHWKRDVIRSSDILPPVRSKASPWWLPVNTSDAKSQFIFPLVGSTHGYKAFAGHFSGESARRELYFDANLMISHTMKPTCRSNNPMSLFSSKDAATLLKSPLSKVVVTSNANDDRTASTSSEVPACGTSGVLVILSSDDSALLHHDSSELVDSPWASCTPVASTQNGESTPRGNSGNIDNTYEVFVDEGMSLPALLSSSSSDSPLPANSDAPVKYRCSPASPSPLAVPLPGLISTEPVFSKGLFISSSSAELLPSHLAPAIVRPSSSYLPPLESLASLNISEQMFENFLSPSANSPSALSTVIMEPTSGLIVGAVHSSLTLTAVGPSSQSPSLSSTFIPLLKRHSSIMESSKTLQKSIASSSKASMSSASADSFSSTPILFSGAFLVLIGMGIIIMKKNTKVDVQRSITLNSVLEESTSDSTTDDFGTCDEVQSKKNSIASYSSHHHVKKSYPHLDDTEVKHYLSKVDASFSQEESTKPSSAFQQKFGFMFSSALAVLKRKLILSTEEEEKLHDSLLVEQRKETVIHSTELHSIASSNSFLQINDRESAINHNSSLNLESSYIKKFDSFTSNAGVSKSLLDTVEGAIVIRRNSDSDNGDAKGSRLQNKNKNSPVSYMKRGRIPNLINSYSIVDRSQLSTGRNSNNVSKSIMVRQKHSGFNIEVSDFPNEVNDTEEYDEDMLGDELQFMKVNRLRKSTSVDVENKYNNSKNKMHPGMKNAFAEPLLMSSPTLKASVTPSSSDNYHNSKIIRRHTTDQEKSLNNNVNSETDLIFSKRQNSMIVQPSPRISLFNDLETGNIRRKQETSPTSPAALLVATLDAIPVTHVSSDRETSLLRVYKSVTNAKAPSSRRIPSPSQQDVYPTMKLLVMKDFINKRNSIISSKENKLKINSKPNEIGESSPPIVDAFESHFIMSSSSSNKNRKASRSSSDLHSKSTRRQSSPPLKISSKSSNDHFGQVYEKNPGARITSSSVSPSNKLKKQDSISVSNKKRECWFADNELSLSQNAKQRSLKLPFLSRSAAVEDIVNITSNSPASKCSCVSLQSPNSSPSHANNQARSSSPEKSTVLKRFLTAIQRGVRREENLCVNHVSSSSRNKNESIFNNLSPTYSMRHCVSQNESSSADESPPVVIHRQKTLMLSTSVSHVSSAHGNQLCMNQEGAASTVGSWTLMISEDGRTTSNNLFHQNNLNGKGFSDDFVINKRRTCRANSKVASVLSSSGDCSTSRPSRRVHTPPAALRSLLLSSLSCKACAEFAVECPHYRKQQKSTQKIGQQSAFVIFDQLNDFTKGNGDDEMDIWDEYYDHEHRQQLDSNPLVVHNHYEESTYVIEEECAVMVKKDDCCEEDGHPIVFRRRTEKKNISSAPRSYSAFVVDKNNNRTEARQRKDEATENSTSSRSSASKFSGNRVIHYRSRNQSKQQSKQNSKRYNIVNKNKPFHKDINICLLEDDAASSVRTGCNSFAASTIDNLLQHSPPPSMVAVSFHRVSPSAPLAYSSFSRTPSPLPNGASPTISSRHVVNAVTSHEMSRVRPVMMFLEGDFSGGALSASSGSENHGSHSEIQPFMTLFDLNPLNNNNKMNHDKEGIKHPTTTVVDSDAAAPREAPPIRINQRRVLHSLSSASSLPAASCLSQSSHSLPSCVHDQGKSQFPLENHATASAPFRALTTAAANFGTKGYEGEATARLPRISPTNTLSPNSMRVSGETNGMNPFGQLLNIPLNQDNPLQQISPSRVSSSVTSMSRLSSANRLTSPTANLATESSPPPSSSLADRIRLVSCTSCSSSTAAFIKGDAIIDNTKSSPHEVSSLYSSSSSNEDDDGGCVQSVLSSSAASTFSGIAPNIPTFKEDSTLNFSGKSSEFFEASSSNYFADEIEVENKCDNTVDLKAMMNDTTQKRPDRDNTQNKNENYYAMMKMLISHHDDIEQEVLLLGEEHDIAIDMDLPQTPSFGPLCQVDVNAPHVFQSHAHLQNFPEHSLEQNCSAPLTLPKEHRQRRLHNVTSQSSRGQQRLTLEKALLEAADAEEKLKC